MAAINWRVALAAAKRRALRFPGVTGVDYGYGYTAGERTAQLCVRFHVSRKIALNRLRPHEVLPSELSSVCCDVVQARYPPQAPPQIRFGAILPGVSVDRSSPPRAGVHIGDVEEPSLGLVLLKSDASCGVMQAVVDGIEGTFEIDYNGYGDQKRWMDGCRLILDPPEPDREISLAGASGAVWVNRETQRAVALHLAGEHDVGPGTGYALAYPISKMFDLPDLTL